MSQLKDLVLNSNSNDSTSINQIRPDEIERISSTELSYDEFFWKFMKPNIPVIITSISNDWECSRQWVTAGEVDLQFLANKIDNDLVPVANCSKVYFNSHEKSEIPFKEYTNYWHNRSNAEQILYLKDWHLKSTKPDYDFYNVPKYFASDWLNEYLIDADKDDYRFVYIGPKGSWTPFHADVFSSFSWSTNIVGIKRWLLLPPGEEIKLRDSLGNDPFSINESILASKAVRYYEIFQKANEAIFVPSQWYHQVWNTTDTISVNHNWFNGCNIRTIWNSLKRSLQSVIKEIADCKNMDDFDGHCQLMLKSVFGIDCSDFLDILEHIGRKRMLEVENISFGTYRLNLQHKTWDLEQICDILKEIIKDKSVYNLTEIENRCIQLLNTIRTSNIK